MSNLLFGEIIEPSSRAIYDSDEELDDSHTELLWKPTNDIETFIIVEGTILINLFKSCVIKNAQLICHLTEMKITIYKLQMNEIYICLLDSLNNTQQSEILNNITSWITEAKNVIGLISLPMVQYQTLLIEEKPTCLIRALSNRDLQIKIPFLEQPNIVTGLSAGAISYRVHINKPASLFICYLDHLPLDSITVQPIMDLLEKLQIPSDKFTPKFIISDSNLYM